MRTIHYEMYAPWLRAGLSLKSIIEEASRIAGFAPAVVVERLPTAHSTGVVVHFHVTVRVPDSTRDEALPNALSARGLVANWWTMPFEQPRRKDEITDPYLAVLAVQVRCAEVAATIWFNQGLGEEAASVRAWAAGTRASLWSLYGVAP